MIKKFRQFESLSNEDFPSLEEIRDYFYDFTDEVFTSIDDYEFGYIFFKNRNRENNIENNIDILKTDISNHILEYERNLLKLNNDYYNFKYRHLINNKNLLELIKSGDEPAYEYLYIHFDKCLFEKDKLSILIDCLRTLYSHTDFRPIKSLWTEDYVSADNSVETFYGFEGTFVRVSDSEYEKLCNIFKQGEKTPILTKIFK
jgi:hypothetical protein